MCFVFSEVQGIHRRVQWILCKGAGDLLAGQVGSGCAEAGEMRRGGA